MSTTEKTSNEAFAESYRSLAGLPKRTSNAPRTNGDGDPSKLATLSEPKGGYGGEGGIDNVGSLRRTGKLASQGTDLVGTEFEDGLHDTSVAKIGIKRKQEMRKDAVGPVTGATSGAATVVDSGSTKAPVAKKAAVKKAAKKSAAGSKGTGK